MEEAGSELRQARFLKFVVTTFVEIVARIVKLAGGFGLGSMAKACPRIAVAQASYSPPVRWFYWEPAAAK